ncbi:MAG TPA: hypothetical protein VK782_03235 [Candidatus Sulfotelmatobacter sp.]|nr:hypothetical protein [Candidatus Sulfotelmatobacter sp.]
MSAARKASTMIPGRRFRFFLAGRLAPARFRAGAARTRSAT